VYGQGVASLFPLDPLLTEMSIEAYVGAPIRGSDGQPLGLLVLMHDEEIRLTDEHASLLHLFATRMGAELERERAEARILSANAELERRVRERTADLAASNAELEAFSYSVSHDLRAPLRAITGFAQAIEEDFGPELPAGAREMFARIERAGTRMGRLIDELLALSRVTRHRLRVVPISVPEVVREVCEELAAHYRDRRVEVFMPEGSVVYADGALFRTVLENVLGNAYKFTAEREVAEIRVVVEEGPETSTIHVSDNGDGFDGRYAARLFQAFQRLHPASRFEGSGIGLATVARIVRRHGGEVAARGEPGRGATFSLTFPRVS
jgi:signal transduction histidine kinase